MKVAPPTKTASANASTKTASDESMGDMVEAVRGAIDQYISVLNGYPVKNLHATVMHTVEAELIAYTLRKHRGHRGRSAETLGISRSTLQRKMEQYDIELS